MSKCIGCGVVLQNIDENKIGYINSLNKDLCQRCFRIRNYNEYSKVLKDNRDYINILKNIDSKELVILVVDLFNISSNLDNISKYIKNDILLVLTKRDILPKSLYDKNLISYFDRYNFNIKDTIIVSSKKNYNMDLLYSKIECLKTSNKVYVVGFTNSGKSTLINKIIYNYSDNSNLITTSSLPSTTIDSIEVKINNGLTLIDTPGLLNDGDIVNYIDKNILKKIVPDKEIKPVTYQITKKCSIFVGEILRIDAENTNFTMYISSKLKIEKVFKEKETNLIKHEIDIKKGMDLVIEGLTFITFHKNSKVMIYTLKDVKVYTRSSLIGGKYE